MQGTTDFLVEEGLADDLVDVPVDTQGKLAKEASSLVGIQHLVHGRFVAVVAGGLDDLAVLDLEAYAGEALTRMSDRDGVVVNDSVHGITHRSRVDFTIRDIAQASARHGRNTLDAESQLGVARPDDLDQFGLGHQLDQRLGGLGHGFVVRQDCLEEGIFEGSGGHTGQLGIGRSRPARQHPASPFQTFLERQVGKDLVEELHLVGRNIGQFQDVVEAAESDPNVGGQIAHQASCRIRTELFLAAAGQTGRQQAIVSQDRLHHDTAGLVDLVDDGQVHLMRSSDMGHE